MSSWLENERRNGDGYPEHLRGDVWEAPSPSRNGSNSVSVSSPHREPQNRISEPPKFPSAVRCAELQATAEDASWLWSGCLARGAVTMLSAHPKAGKTTLLAHLLKALERGDKFCGLDTAPCQVYVVTEEMPRLWAERRDRLGIGNHCRFLSRPFRTKPRVEDWQEFLLHVETELKNDPADLVVFDTVSSLWPVRDENDAAQVQAALMPLHGLTNGGNSGILMNHHLKKNDGNEGTGARGSSALTAFPDTLLELRRYEPTDQNDRRRTMKGLGRWEATPTELVVALSDDGSGYSALGDHSVVASRKIRDIVADILPTEPPGLTVPKIREQWRELPAPRNKALLDELHRGQDAGEWVQEGEGKRNSPYTYWQRTPI